jgi:hypothetical protein
MIVKKLKYTNYKKNEINEETTCKTKLKKYGVIW